MSTILQPNPSINTTNNLTIQSITKTHNLDYTNHELPPHFNQNHLPNISNSHPQPNLTKEINQSKNQTNNHKSHKLASTTSRIREVIGIVEFGVGKTVGFGGVGLGGY